tara:strand:- start:25241 stop:25396 length:156 start_codon:yes stop_codon:yes gene_type:complete
MRPHLEEACEAVDAALLTGDTLQVLDELEKLKEYIARWIRVIDAHEKLEAL